MLKNKTALITGGAQRIGEAIAVKLAESGINIIIHYNQSKDKAQSLAAQLKKHGVQCWTVQADLSNNKEAEQLISKTFGLTKQVDFLINNASTFLPSTLHSLTYDELLSNLQVNAFSPLFIAQTFERQKTKDAAIINILDTRIKQLDLSHVAYQLSKEMLHSLTKMMALAYAPNIRVNAIAPGLILPPPGKDEQHIIERYNLNLLERSGLPDEISTTVLFLLNNTFINGETIYVDGGQKIKRTRYGNK